MNEKLNLVKVLKDCPKGMELDCAMYDNVTLKSVSLDINVDYPITIETKCGFDTKLTKYGQNVCIDDAKCVIFPKGKTTWEGFQRPFKNGDILYIDCNDNEDTYKQYQYTFILEEIREDKIYCHCYIDECIDGVNINKKFETCWLTNMTYNPRFATEEEKQRLFDAIKANGYKWNEETKTLVKLIVPKLKVGDKIKEKNEIFPSTRIIANYNECIGYFTTINDWVRIEDQDNWELVPTHEFKVGDRIRKKGDYICGIIKCIDIDNFYKVEYSGGGVSFVNVKYQNEYELVPNKFNPKSLQPFDKVLVSCNDEWFCDFFSHYDDAVNKFNCTCTGGCPYDCCIPYNDDTKHLIGKSIEDAPEFYRYWEE
jgi:hypothetical protein